MPWKKKERAANAQREYDEIAPYTLFGHNKFQFAHDDTITAATSASTKKKCLLRHESSETWRCVAKQ